MIAIDRRTVTQGRYRALASWVARVRCSHAQAKIGSPLFRVSEQARQRRSRHVKWRIIAGLACVVVVAACSSMTSQHQEDHHETDILDRIRALDLLPRQPQETSPDRNNTSARVRPAVYPGTTVAAIESAPTQPGASGDGFELNFENTPVATVAKVVLGDIMNSGYTIDPRVQGTVTLASGRPVPRSDIIYVLENALRLSGIVLVRDGTAYRLIPQTDQVGSGNIDRVAATAEPGYGISVVPLQYVSAQTLMKLVDSFATKAGTVRADTARNLLLIQGTGAERRAAIETVLTFDVDWMRGQSVGIFPVQNSNPEPMITELEKVLDTGDNGLGQNVVKFQPIARMNAILVVARKPALLRSAETWIKRLDEADTARTGVHVYRLRYGEARQVARVLNEIFVGSSSSALNSAPNQLAPGSGLLNSSSGTGFGQSGQSATNTSQASGAFARLGGFDRNAATNTPGAGPGGAGGAGANPFDARGGGAGAGGGPVLPGVRITADPVKNALLIYASQENYQTIMRTLRELDTPQLQVGIEATVAEVTLNDQLNYGVQFFLQSKNIGLKPDQGSALNTTAAAPPAPDPVTGLTTGFLSRAFPGFNFLIGSEMQPNLILSALHDLTEVKVLSNPSLVVVDNQVATLQVGNQVPISTGTANVLTSNNTRRQYHRLSRHRNHSQRNAADQCQRHSAPRHPAGDQPGRQYGNRQQPHADVAAAQNQEFRLGDEERPDGTPGRPYLRSRRSSDRSGIPGARPTSRKSVTCFPTPRGTYNGPNSSFSFRPRSATAVDAHHLAEELRSKLRGTIGAELGQSKLR